MEEHGCKYEDKLIEMAKSVSTTATNVAWLKKEAEKRNGTFDEHLKESDGFRNQVTRNTIWRWVYKFIITGICGAIGWLITMHYKP